jgi:peptide/nickel transport system substrate-binding protein
VGVEVSKRTIRRREFLKLTAAAGGASLLAACVAPTAAPSGSPAATATTGTAGRYPLGKFEGPTVITDAAKFPKAFKEAPELAALVQQGRLPPVAQRIGQDPLVIQPVHEIGKYGGTLRKAITGGLSGDLTGHRFVPGPASLLFVDYENKKVVPNLARGYEMSADNKVLTLQLRRGMKWSDGQPFTADDILFWFEDIYNNEQIHPGDSPDLLINGKKVVIEKVDASTVRFVSPEANTLLLWILAAPGNDLGGAFRQGLGRGGYAPKHYLQKFHAKYAGEAAANKLAADAKQNGWVANIKVEMDWKANPNLPVVYPWVVKVPLSSPTSFVIERNPYYVGVDTDGNQLPYIGTVQHTVAESTEVVALRATSGELDYQELLFGVAKLPVLIDSQQRGGYKVSLDPQEAGIGIALNLAYEEDPEIGELIRNVDFRRAISMGIDRAQINEALFLGTGIPGSPAPAESNRFFPGKEWLAKWHTLDVAQANQLLDKIGYTQKDGEGYRLRKDGKGRVRLPFMSVDRLADFAAMGEMIKQQWQKIGIDLSVEPTASSLAQQRIQANTALMTGNTVGTEDPFLFTGTLTPGGGGFSAIMGVPYAAWHNSGGKQGKEPPAVIKQALDLLTKGRTGVSEQERVEIGKQLFQLAIDNVFNIGIVGRDLTQGIRIAKTNLGNVPGRTLNANATLSPGGAMPQTFYFK